MLWVLVAVAIFMAGYWYIVRPYNHWIKKGVKQGKTHYLFGDNFELTMRKQSIFDMVETVYKAFPDTRYSGMYQFTLPTLLIRDPELIKQITVKDFDHFLNHRPFIPENSDPLFAGNLFSLNDQRWRDMRTTLSPVFTSSKMKYMFSLITQTGQQFADHFLKKKENVITLEMKETLTRFTNDVIANTAFGIECDSLADKNNEFYMMGRKSTNFNGFWFSIKFILFTLIPHLLQLLRISFFSPDVGEFFTRLVKSNIESREKNGIVRPDMIHLLLEARKNGLKYEETRSAKDTGFATVEESEITKNNRKLKIEITDEAITSQALVFFFAGFETVSSLMCFMGYELGVNPDIQQKLIQEVDDTIEACNGKLTYEALLGMKYLDMVVSESLRKWPLTPFIDRVCTKPYTIEPKLPNEKPLHLEKSEVLWVPVYGIHRDPQYWPEPERFDPERFSDENKANIVPYTYLPFGSGPRNCIGSRFALLETKILFFNILSHFEIVPVEKTKVPLVVSKGFNVGAEGGFWFGLKRRIKN